LFKSLNQIIPKLNTFKALVIEYSAKTEFIVRDGVNKKHKKLGGGILIKLKIFVKRICKKAYLY